MKKAMFLGVCGLAAALAASAAEVHGTLSENGKPLPGGVALKLECGSASAAAKTDEFGSYSLKLAATGDCRLSVEYKGQSASLKVTLFEKPSRYDVEVREEAGKLTLARK